VPLELQENGVYKLELKPESFTLVFPGEELHVCAGLDEELFEHAKAGTDINADFNSYFFIYKYLAGASDSEFLSIEKDTGMSLNKTHGAKPLNKSPNNNRSYYRISSLQSDDKSILLGSVKQLYMAIWRDANKDQFIDPQESMHVQIEFQ
jgi:hypothetical protein